MNPVGRRRGRATWTAVAFLFTLTAGRGAEAQAMAPLAETLDLSSRLYETGMARGDAVLVFAAARLRLSRLPVEPAADAAGWVSGGAMLQAAERLAATDAGLRAMIERQREDIPRGGLEGPQVTSVRIPGESEARLAHAFQGGKPAYIYAEGALTSRLSITVLKGRTAVCRTRIEPARALCRWVADRDGPVTTVVRNLSTDAATILVVTN